MASLSALLLLVVIIGGGLVAYDEGLLDGPSPSGPSATPTTTSGPTGSPTAGSPAAGVDLPSPPAAPEVARAATTKGSLNPLAVSAALAPALGTGVLGPVVAVLVAPLAGGAAAVQSSTPMVPASTMKLLTTTAAIEALGGGTTLTTRVVAGASPKRGPHSVVLVGGGDPYLASRPSRDPAAYPPRADVTTLARRTAATLRTAGVRAVRVGYDASLFTGPAVSPHWPGDYITDDVVAPISALWVDHGNEPGSTDNSADPPQAAAVVFAHALARAGIRVVGAPTPAKAASGAATLGEVQSATVEQMVQETLMVSDNEAAEVLARQVGLKVAGQGSFVGAVSGVQATLRRLGVPLTGAVQYDGSGLSRDDRLEPATLAAVLRLAASPAHPELRPVLEGLPVAGFSGSLVIRDGDATGAARGMVRAKTGTLSGVSGLAGIAEGSDGSQMVFVLLADRIRLDDTLDARAALDRAAAALAACRCGGGT